MFYYVGDMAFDSNYLQHSGVKNMHWHSHRWWNPDHTLTPEGRIHYGYGKERATQIKSPEDLANTLKTFKYKDYDRLMSAEEVRKQKQGSCHDQVMYEMDELRKLGLNPKATFIVEYDDDNQNGMTHSFVTYQKDGKVVWVENAWSERAGLNVFNSFDDIRNTIIGAHKSGEYGNKKKFKYLDFVDFDDRDHKPGETLEEFIGKVYD